MKGKKFKKIIIGVIIALVAGFGVYRLFIHKDPVNQTLENVSKNLNAYYMEANMEFHNGDDIKEYLVKVAFKKDADKNNFRISLLDKGVNQEQILIRNSDGVYVLTPALNQVYKLKGDWPLNGAKPYLYHSMLEVFNGEHEVKTMADGYVVTSKPTYKQSEKWTKQEMKLTNELKPVWLHIYNSDNDLEVKVTFIKVEMAPSFADNYYQVTANMEQARTNLTSLTTATQSDLPLFPTNAVVSATLKEQTVVTISGKAQHILTYEGTDSFTVVQYLATNHADMTITEVNAELVDISGMIGFLKKNELSYTCNGVFYRIFATSISNDKLFEIAQGMEVVAPK